jgi:hypothetical protein
LKYAGRDRNKLELGLMNCVPRNMVGLSVFGIFLQQYAQKSVGFSASFLGICSFEPRKAPFDC